MAITKANIKRFLWEKGQLSWKLDSLQKQIVQTIWDSEGDEVCILSSRQLGKSYATIVFALECCIRNPGIIVRVMSATLKQVNDIVADNLDPITADAPPGFITPLRGEKRWCFANGSELRLGALERAHVDANRGATLTSSSPKRAALSIRRTISTRFNRSLALSYFTPPRSQVEAALSM